MIFKYAVIINEPGYGYYSPCVSYQEALREANKLKAKGYSVVIKTIKQ